MRTKRAFLDTLLNLLAMATRMVPKMYAYLGNSICYISLPSRQTWSRRSIGVTEESKTSRARSRTIAPLHPAWPSPVAPYNLLASTASHLPEGGGVDKCTRIRFVLGEQRNVVLIIAIALRRLHGQRGYRPRPETSPPRDACNVPYNFLPLCAWSPSITACLPSTTSTTSTHVKRFNER